MYKHFDIDEAIANLYKSLDETVLDAPAYDLDEEYAHNTYDLVELAYKHYA